mgnify:CR=1 FL=1
MILESQLIGIEENTRIQRIVSVILNGVPMRKLAARPSINAASAVPPEPQKGSSTRSPG